MIGEKVWSTSLSYNGEVGRLRMKMFDLAKVNIMQLQFVLPNSVFHNFLRHPTEKKCNLRHPVANP